MVGRYWLHGSSSESLYFWLVSFDQWFVCMIDCVLCNKKANLLSIVFVKDLGLFNELDVQLMFLLSPIVR